MMQQFILAIDAGTSRTAAATARLSDERSLLVLPMALGRHSDTAPSTIYAGSGELLFGDAAERRGITEPERLVREIKRRIGDDVPLTIGDRTLGPEELFALLAEWVVETVTEREGRRPSSTVLTVPVTWGPYRTELVSQALSRRGLGDVELITEPEAAARHYEATRPLPPGGVLVVYDLGGGTFDVAVMRKSETGELALIGSPAGLDDLGGVDFDDAILAHALRFANADPGALVSADARVSLASFRRECVDAKESLSFDSEATIPALLGGVHSTVRLTRDEFESMIEHHIERTLDVVADALEAAAVRVADVDAILLTGGSSRIPRIAQLLSERFDRPIATDADPKAIIALGAARASADAGHLPRSTAATAGRDVAEAGARADAFDSEPPAEETPALDPQPVKRRWYQRRPAGAYVAASTIALVGALAVPTAASLANRPASSDEPVTAALAPPASDASIALTKGAGAWESALATSRNALETAEEESDPVILPSARELFEPSTPSTDRDIVPRRSQGSPLQRSDQRSPAAKPSTSRPVRTADDPAPPAVDPAPDPGSESDPVEPGPTDPAPMEPTPVDPGPEPVTDPEDPPPQPDPPADPPPDPVVPPADEPPTDPAPPSSQTPVAG